MRKMATTEGEVRPTPLSLQLHPHTVLQAPCVLAVGPALRQPPTASKPASTAAESSLSLDGLGGSDVESASESDDTGRGLNKADTWSSTFSMNTLPKSDFVFGHIGTCEDAVEHPRSGAEFFMGDFISNSLHNGPAPGRISRRSGRGRGSYADKSDLDFDIEARCELGRVRLCLIYLMWYDVVKLVRPNITGKRLGAIVRQDMRPVLAAIYGDNIDMAWSHKITQIQIVIKTRLSPKMQASRSQQENPPKVKKKVRLEKLKYRIHPKTM
ncbi:hypothetical protein CLAIMM_14333 [Cladophialophora immunda]|nr:hypothetical protein CLAIMM_14333 [Cladophialophora immunda]